MFRDDDHFEDFGDMCLYNLVQNENVESQIRYDEEYLYDDSEEWYNIYESEADV
jgi:hypothetical protein